jgi:signal transduction histidine kinase/CheY-like chemotaxis protein/PAS domain-containing protein
VRQERTGKVTEQEIGTLYELALSINGPEDYTDTIDEFLLSCQRNLQCEAVLFLHHTSLHVEPDPCRATPTSFAESEYFSAFKYQFPLDLLIEEVCNTGLPKTIAHNHLNYLTIPAKDSAILLVSDGSLIWSSEFLASFRRILEQVITLSDKFAKIQDLTDSNQRLTLATKAGAIGTWDFDLATGRLKWDDQMFMLFEVAPSDFDQTYEFFLNCLHREDVQQLSGIIENYVANSVDEPIDFQFRITTPSGDTKKIAGHATISSSLTGHKRLAGVNYDITELETARTQSIYRSQLESLIIDLSMRVIRSGLDDLDDVTNDALQLVGSFINADRAYRFSYDFTNGTVDNTHEWCAEGINPEIHNLQNVPIDAIQVWVTSHKKGLPMFVKRVQDLPQGHGLREILEPQGVLSLVTIPLMQDTQCIGFIGFDAVKQERHWTEVDISLLKLLSDLLVNAEIKNQNERTIQEANAALLESRDTARFLAKEAAAASDAKSRFVARISHEIRTPLHAILGEADLAANSGSAIDIAERIESIKSSGTTLLDLINDVLEFSTAESNEISLKLSPFSVRQLTNDVLKMFEPLALERAINIHLVIDDDLPELLIGDMLRIRQVLNNLIGNAIKFTHLGGVTVRVTCLKQSTHQPEHDDRATIFFEVIDTGLGIATQHLDSIFDPFFQSDDTDALQYAGTGLGLTIAKLLATKMGGSIHVESIRHQGSKFTLELSLAVASKTHIEHKPGNAQKDLSNLVNIRVLLAEDNPVNQQLVRAYLKDLGCVLDIAADGEAAISLYAENAYDLILMDCQMPLLDGYDATRVIRLQEPDNQHIPIIAVTASALKDDKEKCLQTGMDDVLTKPFSKAQLLAVLDQWRPKHLR